MKALHSGTLRENDLLTVYWNTEKEISTLGDTNGSQHPLDWISETKSIPTQGSILDLYTGYSGPMNQSPSADGGYCFTIII
jgi:hypothetical protein